MSGNSRSAAAKRVECYSILQTVSFATTAASTLAMWHPAATSTPARFCLVVACWAGSIVGFSVFADRKKSFVK
jgi:hypothetical protein